MDSLQICHSVQSAANLSANPKSEDTLADVGRVTNESRVLSSRQRCGNRPRSSQDSMKCVLLLRKRK